MAMGDGRDAPPPLVPGGSFRDCDVCPEMIVVPGGSFVMGWDKGDPDEKPSRQVAVTGPFAVGKFEVTFDQWDACIAGGGCGAYHPPDKEWGRRSRPGLLPLSGPRSKLEFGAVELAPNVGPA